MISKRGQVTIFIIIAILIVAFASLFFMFRGTIKQQIFSASLEPVYLDFVSCVEENTLVAVDVLEVQAGYLDLPEFESGSRAIPFSSQLDFLGNPVPYWYYVSGNNIQKEQIPSKRQMEEELEQFLEEEILLDCNFEGYSEQGFEIEREPPLVKVDIKERSIELQIDMPLSIEKAGEVGALNKHEISVQSSLGKLYNSAKIVYEFEQETLFLEQYGVDVLRFYAPVDGVELTCSPKTWIADEVFNELEEAIESNTAMLKSGSEKDYFSVDIPVDVGVRFINSKAWPRSFEVTPSEGSVLVATPIGNQQGLGILGFCYVPYHFVYSVRYPILVQVYEGEEFFQFPVAVAIENNNPRKSLDVSAVEFESSEACLYKNTLIDVSVYDSNFNVIEADISYECFGETCDIGKAPLETEFPQCANGRILAKADGFEEGELVFSTINEGSVSLVLNKLHSLNVDLKIDRRKYDESAIIYFVSDKSSQTVVYPEQISVQLSEGTYEVQVYTYQESAILFEETTMEQCVDIPRTGVGGFLGLTQEKCFDLQVPEQTISPVLAGGGVEELYVFESELASSNYIEINAESLPLPNSLEQIQDNNILFESKTLEISLR